MKTHKVKYTNESIGKIKIINDFLPSPEQLILQEENVKVTLSLSKASVEFFKQQAREKHTQYQKMIRALLDKYANHFS
jgi:predicted DNA binding CopG/RHH family protein